MHLIDFGWALGACGVSQRMSFLGDERISQIAMKEFDGYEFVGPCQQLKLS
jgi:hypothetical protein